MALHAVLGWLAGWGVTMECRLTPEQAREWGRESLRKNVQAYCRMHHMLMLAYPGKTVLIEAERFIGVFDAYEDALEHGYSEFNLGSFFVHVVEPIGSRPKPFIESQHWPRGADPVDDPLGPHKYAGRVFNYKPNTGLDWSDTQ